MTPNANDDGPLGLCFGPQFGLWPVARPHVKLQPNDWSTKASTKRNKVKNGDIGKISRYPENDHLWQTNKEYDFIDQSFGYINFTVFLGGPEILVGPRLNTAHKFQMAAGLWTAPARPKWGGPWPAPSAPARPQVNKGEGHFVKLTIKPILSHY